MEANQLTNIIRAAVDAQAYRACQYLQALITVAEHTKLRLGYPGELKIDQHCEQNADGMLDSAIATLADDPPIPIYQSVAGADVDGILDPYALEAAEDQLASEPIVTVSHHKVKRWRKPILPDDAGKLCRYRDDKNSMWHEAEFSLRGWDACHSWLISNGNCYKYCEVEE